MVLSSVIIILVSGTFLVQSQYYSSQTLRAGVHDNARVATERMAGEIRSTMEDGFLVAGARTLTVRSPIVVTVICARQGGGDGHIYTEGGEGGLDTDEVAGLAVRDPLTGAWTYGSGDWSYLNNTNDTESAERCHDNGADTTGATIGFHRIRHLDDLFSPTPDEGDVIMLFRETTFRIQPSVLDTMTLGLFRQTYGGSPVEFATGMDTTAQFQYRTGGSSYADTVTGASVGNIDAVRIVADARLPARSGVLEDATFGWSVNIAVRNLP